MDQVKSFKQNLARKEVLSLTKRIFLLRRILNFKKKLYQINKENIQIYPFIDSWQRGKKGVFMTTMMFLLVWIAALSMAQDCLTVKDELELVSRKNISLEIWNLQLFN